MSRELLDISHVSNNGPSLRISLSVKVKDTLGIGPNDIIAFYYEEGKITIEKMK